MPVSSLEGLSDAQKQELVASLSAIVVGSSGADVTAEALNAVATASGNNLSEAWASVFAGIVAKVRPVVVNCHLNTFLYLLMNLFFHQVWRN